MKLNEISAVTVPLLNPDGYQYHYSQTHSGPQDWSATPLEQDVIGGVDANRWIGGWKKNRREITTRNGTKCVGVDLRNNFRKGFGKNDNYRWMPPPFVPTFLPNGLSDSYPFRPHDLMTRAVHIIGVGGHFRSQKPRHFETTYLGKCVEA